MKTNFSQVEATQAGPWSARIIDWLLAKPEEREKSIVLGDSVGLTEEDIERKVRRVKGSVQVERLITTMPFGGSEPSDVLYLTWTSQNQAENYVVGLVPEPDLEVRDDLEYVYRRLGD